MRDYLDRWNDIDADMVDTSKRERRIIAFVFVAMFAVPFLALLIAS